MRPRGFEAEKANPRFGHVAERQRGASRVEAAQAGGGEGGAEDLQGGGGRGGGGGELEAGFEVFDWVLLRMGLGVGLE